MATALNAHLRYTIGVIAILSLALFAACNGDQQAEEQRRADSVLQAQRIQDSMAQLEAEEARLRLEAENARRMEEEQRIREQSAKKFHVILGSFRVPENATNFCALQQRSYSEAKIFDAPNGFKLVSIADFATMQEAVAFILRLQSGQEEGDQMWVFEEGGVYDTSAYLNSLYEYEEYEEF